jgi:hypothetical protein
MINITNKHITITITPLMLIWFEVQTGWTWMIDLYFMIAFTGGIGIEILWWYTQWTYVGRKIKKF